MKQKAKKITMKQKALFKISEYNSEFGGSLLQGKRKIARPISSKNTMKIVLRADMKATELKARENGVEVRSLLKFRKEIDKAFALFAEKFGVKLYEKALVSNHIHFVAKFGSRDHYKKFMRALTGTLSKQLKIKWHLRPWSRIVAWGRALKAAIQYTIQNHREAIGEIPYQMRPDDHHRTRFLLRRRSRY